jgi:competence CoiA-like predicted nuclease
VSVILNYLPFLQKEADIMVAVQAVVDFPSSPVIGSLESRSVGPNANAITQNE